MAYEDWQQKVIDEQAELSDKIDNLEKFIDSEAFKGLPETDRGLLIMQSVAMEQYQIILKRRINRF